jgi:hypothetical protein
MKSKTYNGEVRCSEKDFETLQLGAFATPGLLLILGLLQFLLYEIMFLYDRFQRLAG